MRLALLHLISKNRRIDGLASQCDFKDQISFRRATFEKVVSSLQYSLYPKKRSIGMANKYSHKISPLQ